jgi:hypothetical protein
MAGERGGRRSHSVQSGGTFSLFGGVYLLSLCCGRAANPNEILRVPARGRIGRWKVRMRLTTFASLILVWSTIGMGAQESANSALLEKSRQALTKRDYMHALELLKQVDPARPERATMLAVANGMACQQDPSADAPQCAMAKQFFTQVLSHSSNDGLALSWLGALSLGEMRGHDFAKLDEVRGYFTTLLAGHPDEPAWRAESEYWLGVTAWMASYWRNLDARENYNRTSGIPLRGSDPLPEPVRIEYARQCRDMINQGIEILQKRMDQQPKDSYSLAFLNLLLRRRADLQESAEMRARDLRMADQLVSRIQEVQKSGALVIDIPLHPAVPPPPPPPPPPRIQPE